MMNFNPLMEIDRASIRYICAAFVVGVIIASVAIIIGVVAANAVRGVARNPEASGVIWAFFLQAFALIEINVFIAVSIAAVFVFLVK